MTKGVPCPVCGSTNTYVTSTALICRAQGHRTPINQGNNQPQQRNSGGGGPLSGRVF